MVVGMVPLIPSILQLVSAASKNLPARRDHFLCESKLLAVEDEESSIIQEILLYMLTLVLQLFFLIHLLLIRIVHYADTLGQILSDFIQLEQSFCALIDSGLKLLADLVQVIDHHSQSFKGHHLLCFLLQHMLVVFLVKDLFINVKIVDSIPEVMLGVIVVVTVVSVIVLLGLVVVMWWLARRWWWHRRRCRQRLVIIVITIIVVALCPSERIEWTRRQRLIRALNSFINLLEVVVAALRALMIVEKLYIVEQEGIKQGCSMDACASLVDCCYLQAQFHVGCTGQ